MTNSPGSDDPLPHVAPSPAATPTTVVTEVTVDAPLEEVWELLVDDELSTWLGDEVTLEPVPGGRGHVTDDDGVGREIRVDEVDPGRSISWRWWPADRTEDASDVRIVLLPNGDRTEIRVTEISALDRYGWCAERDGARPASLEAAHRRAAWSTRMLSAELSLLCRHTVLVAVRA